MIEYNEYTIDVEKIARARKGGEKIPKWVLKLVKKMIHQDFINEFLCKGYEGEEFARECVKTLGIKTDISGEENFDLIPEGVHCSFVANHPLGGIDAIVLLNMLLPRFNGNVRFLVNDFLMNLKGIAPLAFGVNKLGAQDRGLSAAIHGFYDSDHEMMFFPAGLCSRKINGKVQDREWAKTFVKESIRTNRWIVPIHFIAENSWRFYFVDRLCKIFHIKTNLAMFLLPDEMYRGRGRTVKVVIGEPIAPASLDKSKNYFEWAQDIRQRVYNL